MRRTRALVFACSAHSLSASLICHSTYIFQASPKGGMERILDLQPEIIYLKFENAKWRVHEQIEHGVYPMKAKGKIWIISEGTKISARRRGFNIVPDFGQTAHSMQGASEIAVIVDCFTVDHCAKYSETLAAYIGISRVRTKEGLLIAEPFSTALFCHGQPPGPEILMKVLRREITPDDAKQDNCCSLCLYLFLLRTAPKQQCSVAHVMYAFASAEVFCILVHYLNVGRSWTSSSRNRETRAWRRTSRR